MEQSCVRQRSSALRPRAFVTGVGLVSSLGIGCDAHLRALRNSESGIGLLTLFGVHPDDRPLPVGMVPGLNVDADALRISSIAGLAAEEALQGFTGVIDALIVGVTTGGMSRTELLVVNGEDDPVAYARHGVGSVAEELSRRYGVEGPVLTVSTSCSSSNVAFALAFNMIRKGMARTVLAGGADSLCRFTYHGFRSLQVVDPDGARPMDSGRRGMSVSEGAGMLLIQAGQEPPPGAWGELAGAGLSCDAFHATAPHPEGRYARLAMLKAMEDSSVSAAEIDYINLHGTGTSDNDRVEATVVSEMFDGLRVVASSTKGMTGHALGAAGAIEAGICLLAMRNNIVPPNVPLVTPDAAVRFDLPAKCRTAAIGTVLSNSFGFGGNNASILLRTPGNRAGSDTPVSSGPLKIRRWSALSAAGDAGNSCSRLMDGLSLQGILPGEQVCRNLSPRPIRRLRRLHCMALSLAEGILDGADERPEAVFVGTAWGPQSETWASLEKLRDTGWLYHSPMDFAGSVNNGPASQIAILQGLVGPNLTASGHADSFAQALMMAKILLKPQQSALVVGAEEWNEHLTPLFDPDSKFSSVPSDGGGALLIERVEDCRDGIDVDVEIVQACGDAGDEVERLLVRLGGRELVSREYPEVWVDLPESEKKTGLVQWDRLVKLCRWSDPVWIRPLFGDYNAAVATATAVALERLAREDSVRRGCILLGLGSVLSAIVIRPPSQT